MEHIGTTAIERSMRPIVVKQAEVLDGIGIDSAPALKGYIRFESKPSADVLLKMEKKDPLLVRWQYGLGSSAIFTSDAKSRWHLPLQNLTCPPICQEICALIVKFFSAGEVALCEKTVAVIPKRRPSTAYRHSPRPRQNRLCTFTTVGKIYFPLFQVFPQMTPSTSPVHPLTLPM